MYKPVGIGTGTAAGGALAFTGMNVLPWVLLGVGIVVVGAVLLRLTMVRTRR